jgi:erythromycin esterase
LAPRIHLRIPPERRVRFYGLDLPRDGGGNLLPALEPVWAYLQQVDSAFATVHRSRIDGIARELAVAGWWDVDARYESLGQARRDTLRRGIDELSERFAAHRQQYLRRSTPEQFAWAERLVEVARQTESMLRAGKSSPQDLRDVAMAANARWVMERERARGRVVLLAHNLHVQAAPLEGPFFAARRRALADLRQDSVDAGWI